MSGAMNPATLLDPKFSACRKRTPEDFEDLNRKIAAWTKAHPVQMWLVCIGIVLGVLEVALILKLFVERLGRKLQL